MAPEDGVYHVCGLKVWRQCPETVEVRKGDRCLWLGHKEKLFELNDAKEVAKKVASHVGRYRLPQATVETLAHVLHRVANRPFIATVDHVIITKPGHSLAFSRRGDPRTICKEINELRAMEYLDGVAALLLCEFDLPRNDDTINKLVERIKEWL